MRTKATSSAASTRRLFARLGIAALAAGLLSAPGASAAQPTDSTTTSPGPRACIAQILASGHDEILEGSPVFVIGTQGDDWGPGASWGGIACGLAGDDYISDMFGHFVGGPGNDSIGAELFGVFIGGAGDDFSDEVPATDANLRPLAVGFDGGPGNDTASRVNGTFRGGPGNDTVTFLLLGAFDGGPGNDRVTAGGGTSGPTNTGTFAGGPGNDSADVNQGHFDGGAGNDTVVANEATFDGGRGDDRVERNYGTFIGGPGYDTVGENFGTCIGVEAGC